MLPGMEMLACPNLAVSPEVMQHVVQVESGANPYAIGVVGGRLARQPRNMGEALATARMLEGKGYNFSVGIAQVNRANLGRYGLDTYRKAFNTCNNLVAGAKILARCYRSAHGDWGKAFSCYYSGNFRTGFRDGYVQKVYASMSREAGKRDTAAHHAIPLETPVGTDGGTPAPLHGKALRSVVVYPGDSARYRVALRSTPVDGAAAATMPLVLSAKERSPHLTDTARGDAMTRKPPQGSDPRGAFPARPGPDIVPPIAARTPASRAVTSAKPQAAGGAIFKPQVRGPNDPAPSARDLAQRSKPPHANSADLRLEKSDAAFVF